MRLVVATLLLSCTGLASAQVNRCVDSNGKVSYQDRACGPNQRSTGPNPNSGGFVASVPGTGPTYQENVDGYLDQRAADRSQARAEQRAAHQAIDEQRAQKQVPIDPDLQRKCGQEQRSIDRRRNGTPSCDQLDRIYGIQKPTKIIVNNHGGSHGPTTRFDQYGNTYTDFGNGAPVINQQTGRPCTSLGGNNVRCD